MAGEHLWRGSNGRRSTEGDGSSFSIDRDQRDGGLRDRDCLAVAETLGLDFDLDGDRCGAQAGGCGVKGHDIAKVNRRVKIDPIERGSDPPVATVDPGLDEARLVDVAEDGSAKDGAVDIGVSWHGNHPQGESPLWFVPVGVGWLWVALVRGGVLGRGGHVREGREGVVRVDSGSPDLGPPARE